MTSTAALIRKLWAGEATTEELATLQEMLDDENCSLKDELLEAYEYSLRFSSSHPLLDKTREQEILMALHMEIALDKPGNTKVLSFRRTIVWAAACFILFIAGATFWVKLNMSTRKASHDLLVAAATQKKEPVIIFNHSDTIQSIVLADSSLVALSPASKLILASDFNVSKRDIGLEGKATFKVAKNTMRPFTVLARGFATTALGTQFTINTLSGDIVDIKLLEGKVVVKQVDWKQGGKQVFLLPKEEFICNTTTGLTTVKRFENERLAGDKTKAASASSDLVFDNESLEEVFIKLQSAFDTKIQIDSKELAIMTLTGTFHKKDGLQKVLAVICNMNDLAISDSSGVFIISKKN